MSNQITILVGTMTGTAELVAQDVEPELQNAGFDVEIIDMDGLDIDVFEPLIICCILWKYLV